MNLMYRAPQNTTQGKRLSMMSLDLGLSKDVLDKNGTFILAFVIYLLENIEGLLN